MPEKEKKTCYYELLGLDRKCDAAEIKTTYRKAALRMHPDKAHVNGITVEEATKRFQQIQEAYSVLSDPQERAWYDAHREQILKGHDDGEPAEDPFKTRINLYKYFSSSCYDGFGDGANGFFAVYADLFVAIDTEEAEWEDLDSDEEHRSMPPFGDSGTEGVDVTAFYRNWLDFCSRKAFGHADKWNPKEAPNRQVRRAMEMENKKARQAAKKEFNAEVRQLVKFVQKRDPRVIAHQKQQMKDNAEKKQRDVAEAQERKAAEAAERKERQEAARFADEARWAEVAAEREARRARGEVVSEDEDKDEEEEDVLQFVCEPCRKSFKSEKAYDQHAKSKKHLQVVESLRRELEREMKQEAKAAAKKAAALEAMEGGGGGTSASEGSEAEVEDKLPGFAAAAKQAPGQDSEQKDESDEDSDDDAFLARFAARGGAGRGGRGRGGFAPPPRGGEDDGGGSSASSDSGAVDEAAAGGGDDGEAGSKRRPAAASKAAAAAAEEGAGKRAQKKAQQKALLLEKKSQKEGVEELVNGVKKAQKAAKQDGGGAGGAAAAGEAAESESAAAAEAKPAHSPKDTVAAGGSSQAVAPSDGTRCAVCGEDFPSRSKLFQHIKVSGHAALKVMEPPGGAKGKKKKR